MKRILFFLLSLVISIGIFWFITEKIGWQDIFQPFLLIRYWQGFVIILLTLIIFLFNILCWQFILKSQGYNVSLSTLGDVWTAGFAISYLTPIAFLGGEVFMSLTLRKKTSISCKKNIPSIIILRILNGATVLLISLFGIFAFLSLMGILSNKIIITAIIVLGLLIFIIFYFHKRLRIENISKDFFKYLNKKIVPKGNSIIEIEKEISSFFNLSNKTIWHSLGIIFIIFFLRITRLWLIVLFISGITISFFQILAIFAFVSMAYFLPLPAALGSLEASQSFVFVSLGLGAGMGAAFSLILRAAELFLAFIGIFFLIKFWIKFQIFDKILQKIRKIFP